MNISTLLRSGAILGVALWFNLNALAERRLPAELKDWQDWATWDVQHRHCPTPYNNPERHVCFWPGELSLQAGAKSAAWELKVAVFGEAWVPLPGGGETWPVDVKISGKPLTVVEREGRPCVKLSAGQQVLTGAFLWENEMPQLIRVPREVGLLSLSLEGKKVELPNWDEAGNLWLKRARVEATDKDTIAAQVWRVIEDGIPLWLRSEIELSVSGKSREEDLGTVIPEGWSIASVDAPVPLAVDEQGRMKAQVRAGKWIIRVDAFRAADAREIKFAAAAQPVVSSELIAFRAAPEFRMADLEGVQQVDVGQTTFPEKWRELPVYQWPTDQPFRLTEKMRGMGLQKPEGLRFNRVFWLDEDGHGLTFRDQITGNMQQIWRLDIAPGQELGAAKMDGQAQLITTNPVNGAQGLEIRARNVNLSAIGRSAAVRDIPATGWRASAEGLNVSLNLPPGWRLFALFGADRVDGDWLTAWTLLDLFLLLIFTLAVFKLWGFKAGLVAFLAFGLGYHEPGAPRYAWFMLLVPLALLRVVPPGVFRKVIQAWVWLAVAVMVFVLIPFVTMQLQGVLYPQLEPSGTTYGERTRWAGGAVSSTPMDAPSLPASVQQSVESESYGRSGGWGLASKRGKIQDMSNLKYDAKAKIQTGPAEPEWSWNQVSFGWNGPVSAEEKVRPILISLNLHRGLTVLRVALIFLLAATLLRSWRNRKPSEPPLKPAGGALPSVLLGLALALGAHSTAYAEMPDAPTLKLLRERLLEKSDAFPQAADIASAALQVKEARLTMAAEIHTAVPVAVPLPGKLPAWSPVSVTVDGQPAAGLGRAEGYLWVLLPEGVHQVQVEGLLPATTEWEWTFLLKPRRVTIEAPGWTVTGLRPNGVPENQVFFARQRTVAVGEAEYDRKDFNAVVLVNRHIEVGLLWQTRVEVTRLSPAGKAVSLRVPLLAGEKVLSPGVQVDQGFVEVRLGAGENEFGWESVLPVGDSIALSAAQTDRWVERWQLVASPVWNASIAGLAPVFETSEQNLIPVWHPWPGESVTLTFSKPEAVSGDTLTVRRVAHEISLGSRQRSSSLTLELEASLGDDFLLEIGPDAEVSSLKQDARELPVRLDGSRLVIPVRPGSQSLSVEWRTSGPQGTIARGDVVKLPVEAANISTTINVSNSRWVLWAGGPLRGPAVRFWMVLLLSALAAWVLGGLKRSPVSRVQWLLLALGLTQIHFAAALIVVAWFFLVAWRGHNGDQEALAWRFNFLQLFIAGLTVLAMGVLVVAVSEGLLGNPEMFIRGNGSSRTALRWFEPRSGTELPMPMVVSVSVWFYRLLMLAWALWLAASLVRWLKWAWTQFSAGGCWKKGAPKANVPPPLPEPKG